MVQLVLLGAATALLLAVSAVTLSPELVQAQAPLDSKRPAEGRSSYPCPCYNGQQPHQLTYHINNNSNNADYRLRTGYDRYSAPTTVNLPAGHNPPAGDAGLQLALLGAVSAVLAAVAWAASHAAALALGGVLALAACMLTPFCNKWRAFTPVVEMRGLAAPERISRSADFLLKAINQYQAEETSKQRR